MDFNGEKVIAALRYICGKSLGNLTIIEALKVVFYGDIINYAKTGNQITDYLWLSDDCLDSDEIKSIEQALKDTGHLKS